MRKKYFFSIIVVLGTSLLIGGCSGVQKEIKKVINPFHKEEDTEVVTVGSIPEEVMANQVDGEALTISWFNASYAILTFCNGQDYTLYGGTAVNEVSTRNQQISLKEWWGITNRESADEMMDWILYEGHRTAFREECKAMENVGIGNLSGDERLSRIAKLFKIDQEEAKPYAKEYEMYEQYGENAIDAWDYSRALNLLSWYYVCGYYTLEESLERSYQVGLEIQKQFNSWEEYVESYLRGYEYWSEESSDERRQVYEYLLSQPDNPYAIDFNLHLEKCW